MDNPHILESELGYLAGIIDGEGTITLERSGKRRLCGVMGLVPKVVVANSNEAIVNYVIMLFKKIGITPYIKTQIAGKYGRHKKMYWIIFHGLTRTTKALTILLPYLVGKLAQAQLVLEFNAYRGDPIKAKGRPYGPIELGILQKIRALNFRGMSETEDPTHMMRNDSPPCDESHKINE